MKWIAAVSKKREENARIRWIAALPAHLAAMAEFTLQTGLRRANVTGLRWEKRGSRQKDGIYRRRRNQRKTSYWGAVER
ncbi:MAG: hypothetical protein ACYDCW_15210 [Acidithiobacillus ferrivorans]